MIRRIAKVGIVILLIASCGFKKGYIPPVSENSAKLFVPNPFSKSGIFSSEYGRSSAVQFGIANETGCAELYTADEPNKRLRNGFIELTIPHNKNIFVNYNQTMNNTYCGVSGYFYSNAKVSYKVLVRPTQYGCRLEVKAAQKNGISYRVPIQAVHVDPWNGIRVCTTAAAI